MELEQRARMHAALGDPERLALVDHLALSDRSPSELSALLDWPSNLLAHHLRVLEEAGVVRRKRSDGDRRRSYVQLAIEDDAVARFVGLPTRTALPPRVVFVCTHNSARSQLAAAAWSHTQRTPASSAGTEPAACVHPRAQRVGRRHGLVVGDGTHHVEDVIRPGDLVVSVCDQAHEAMVDYPFPPALHWAIPDPVETNSDRAFETAYAQISQRVDRLAAAVSSNAK